MKWLGFILFSSIPFALGSLPNLGIVEIRDCTGQFTNEINKYQDSLSRVTWRYDPIMTQYLHTQESLKETLSWANRKDSDHKLSSVDYHLLGNGFESCKAAKTAFIARAKSISLLFYLIPTSLFLLVTYLIIMIPMAFHKLDSLLGFSSHRNLSNKNITADKMLWFFVFFISLSSANCVAGTLNVYTYDALTGKSSFGEVIKKAFEAKTGATLKWVSFATGGEALNQIIIEGKKTNADILLGIDSSFANRAVETGLFSKISSTFFLPLQTGIKLDESSLFLPFDYGYLAFMFDSKRVHKKPSDFGDLSLAQFLNLVELNKRIVIEDPRTSSIGFSFLRWTEQNFKKEESLKMAWKMFFPKLITLAPGWTAAYGMFLKGEADWVLSYTTSRAYHLEKEKKDQFQFLVFSEGHVRQVEGAGVLKGSSNKALINSFLEILISDQVQSQIATTQWMYPAKKGIELPESFNSIPVPKAIEINYLFSEKKRKMLIKEWTQWVSSSP